MRKCGRCSFRLTSRLFCVANPYPGEEADLAAGLLRAVHRVDSVRPVTMTYLSPWHGAASPASGRTAIQPRTTAVLDISTNCESMGCRLVFFHARRMGTGGASTNGMYSIP